MTRNLLVCCAVALVPGVLAAEEDERRSADREAIMQGAELYVEAFNRGDAEGVAGLFTETAEHIDQEGNVTRGREAILKGLQETFAGLSGARISVEMDSLRFIAPGVALEHGTSTLAMPDGEPSRSGYTVVHVKTDDGWKMESVRVTALPAKASNYEHLKELEWMIGDWVDEGEESKVETTCRWTANRNFIQRSFTVSVQGAIELAGTQVIAWDAADKRIRSWVFDSDGGFGEGTWTRDGERWIVRASGVLQDGGRASSINIFTRVDENTFTWSSVAREVDGELLPNIDAVTVVRKTQAAE